MSKLNNSNLEPKLRNVNPTLSVKVLELLAHRKKVTERVHIQNVRKSVQDTLPPGSLIPNKDLMPTFEALAELGYGVIEHENSNHPLFKWSDGAQAKLARNVASLIVKFGGEKIEASPQALATTNSNCHYYWGSEGSPLRIELKTDKPLTAEQFAEHTKAILLGMKK